LPPSACHLQPLFGHSQRYFWTCIGGACLCSFCAGFQLRDSKSDKKDLFLGSNRPWGRMATVTEYPAAPASVILALLALFQVWGMDGRGVTGSLLALQAQLLHSGFASYQHAAFGSILSVTYSHYQPGQFPVMDTGFHGLTYPRVGIMASLLISPHLGLFLLAPILFFAPFGLFLLWKQGKARACPRGCHPWQRTTGCSPLWLGTEDGVMAHAICWQLYMCSASDSRLCGSANVGFRVCLALLAICGMSR
jgi:hypothetical protein